MYLYSNYRFDTDLMNNVIQAYHTVGFNGTTPLAWYIEPASVTISLWFRYQYLHYILWSDRSESFYYSFGGIQRNLKNMNDDHFHGITLSAIYSLEF